MRFFVSFPIALYLHLYTLRACILSFNSFLILSHSNFSYLFYFYFYHFLRKHEAYVKFITLFFRQIVKNSRRQRRERERDKRGGKELPWEIKIFQKFFVQY